MSQMEVESTGEERSNSLLGNTRCSFCFPCFGRRRSANVGVAWWERVRTSSWSQTRRAEDHWWSRGFRVLKKLREWSEIVAGPRWKTFIRRFNRNRSGGCKHGKCQYDAMSYALNFDEGQNADFEEGDYAGLRNFSTRYAAVPGSISVKSVSTDAVMQDKDVAIFA
ncbi:hypothetical protein L6164_011079 [Bauhinia variegata]|uniref:Uncharacterized protein n=1 Tax=Bauhinia variegata TaxID=167791 RepID=A0ACB9P5H6_BAUVA|nr:hypothetical protein L6164_011079 [Bauhinia variegata]